MRIAMRGRMHLGYGRDRFIPGADETRCLRHVHVAVKGSFTAKAGTGTLAHTQWGGTIRGQLVSVSPVGLPTYLSIFSGPCHNLA